MPWTINQQKAMSYSLYFNKLTESACNNNEEEYPEKEYKINSIIHTDSSFIVDISIVENCGYDFICDSNVDSKSQNIQIKNAPYCQKKQQY